MKDIKFYINPENSGFYQTDINTSIPDKAIEISVEERHEILNCILSGGVVTFNKDKYQLSFIEQKEIDKKSAIYAERCWRDSELSKADVQIFKLEDSPKDCNKEISVWRGYRTLLRDYPSTTRFPYGKRPSLNKDLLK
jgi:hypothetical protein